MSLSDLWRSNPDELGRKTIAQLVSLAGDGRLTDGGSTSSELREFLQEIPIDVLNRYCAFCISQSFDNSGKVLQDLVNEIGRRLGFLVQHGLYQGKTGEASHDGLWFFPDGETALLVEVKTSDNFPLHLDRLARYRTTLRNQRLVHAENNVSILVVVGIEANGSFQAQVRGSGYAPETRIISVDALIHLLNLQEITNTEGSIAVSREILRPWDFTKLDDLVGLLHRALEQPSDADDIEISTSDTSIPASGLRANAIARFNERHNTQLRKQSDTILVSGHHVVICLASKYYGRKGYTYWFGLRTRHVEALRQTSEAYLLLVCGDPVNTIELPAQLVLQWVDSNELNFSARDEGGHFHIHIAQNYNQLELVRKRGQPRLDLSEFRI